ncbi:hypothetical protein BR93DRAFT_173718 [Coniochaeta sp. PMI_546]|nr:hypothetical protein BR93DRAFT_173718 [Coniochaeta sp. PMI_546]
MNVSATNLLSEFIDNLDNEQVKSYMLISENALPDEVLHDLLRPQPGNTPICNDADHHFAPKAQLYGIVNRIGRKTDDQTIDRTLDDAMVVNGEGGIGQSLWNDTTVGFRKIGFGQCGLIFQRPGRDFVVKIARPGFHDALWSDFVAHFHVYNAFRDQGNLVCRVPKVYSYIKRDNLLWTSHLPLFEAHDSFPMPSMALVTERIPPLPKIVREALIHKYCPPNLRIAALANPSNRDCLARVYLGRRRPESAPLAPNFSLRNFNLCLDQMEEHKLPVNTYAEAMGEALAVLHWLANVDGYDVEFVIGTEADTAYINGQTTDLGLTSDDINELPAHTDTNVMTLDTMMPAQVKKRILRTRMWVLDFNLCSRWEERIGWEQPDALIQHLVLAFFENDPYYPLPLAEGREQILWEAFRDSYLRKSGEILQSDGKDERLIKLPGMFIGACVAREKEKMKALLGHGHRDLKG